MYENSSFWSLTRASDSRGSDFLKPNFFSIVKRIHSHPEIMHHIQFTTLNSSTTSFGTMLNSYNFSGPTPLTPYVSSTVNLTLRIILNFDGTKLTVAYCILLLSKIIHVWTFYQHIQCHPFHFPNLTNLPNLIISGMEMVNLFLTVNNQFDSSKFGESLEVTQIKLFVHKVRVLYKHWLHRLLQLLSRCHQINVTCSCFSNCLLLHFWIWTK